MYFFDPVYFLYMVPALLLALWAQARVRSSFAAASKVPARLSGAAAGRFILDAAGLQDLAIEPIPGQLSDHYDPRAKVLRLSQGVYGMRNLAAVGIAAHEAGHAIQDAKQYAPLVVRNAAVPIAGFGANISMFAILGGFLFQFATLIYVGIALFGAVVLFQLINLPVEFNASSRAKRLLVEHGIVDSSSMQHVNKVLNAAALTYVAATLQSVLTLLYLILRFTGGGSDD